MLQLSKVVPSSTATRAGPWMTQSVKVLPLITDSPAFMVCTASSGSHTPSFSKVVRATISRPKASDITSVMGLLDQLRPLAGFGAAKAEKP